MAASELPEDQFTQDFRTQRRNYSDGDTRLGDHDRLWYDGRTKTIRVYDGTAGGTILAGAAYISEGIEFSNYVTFDDLADAVEATFSDSDYVSESELSSALSSYATIAYVDSQVTSSTPAGYNNTNWDTAFGWGDHSTAGYATLADLNQDSSDELQNWAEDSSGNLLPDSDAAYDIGSPTQRVRDLYVSSNSIHVGDYVLSESTGVLHWNGEPVVSSGSLHVDNHSITVSSSGDLELDGTPMATASYVDSSVSGLASTAYVDASVPDLDPYATTAYVDTQISNITLDSTAYIDQTELDAALADYSTTASLNISNWDTAHGWGDHSAANYLVAADIAGKADTTTVNAALALKANAADVYTQIQTDTEISNAVANLVNSAPAALDTLGELAAALEANDSSDDSTATWLQGLINTNAAAIAGKADAADNATQTWVNSQGYLTAHQDISGKADISYVDSEIAGITLDTIVADDTKVQVVDASAGGVIELHTAGTHRWTITELGHLVPNGNALYDIGEAENKVRHFYLSSTSVTIGEGTLSQDETTKKLLWDNDGSSTGYSQQFLATENYVDTAVAGAGGGDVTLAGSYDYLTLSGQELTLNQIDAATDISGISFTSTSTFIGDGVGTGHTNDNTVIGYQAGQSNNDNDNIIIGKQAAKNKTFGFQNVLIGNEVALDADPDYGVVIGHFAGQNTTNQHSVIIGYEASRWHTSGGNNVVVGSQAGEGHEDSTATTYHSTTLVGRSAGRDLSTGNSNTLIGYIAGNTITTGRNNTIIGTNAQASSATVINETAIGYNATGNGDNTVTLGDSNVTGFYVGEHFAVVDVPGTSHGASGDFAGMVAMDATYMYYCTTDYTDGVADIWKRVAWGSDTW